MSTLSTDQLLILLGYAGAIVAMYVTMNMRIKALEIQVKQIQKDADNYRLDSQKMDERVTKKFDTILEKFELVNNKINQLILQYTTK